jgi:hypothetical protein
MEPGSYAEAARNTLWFHNSSVQGLLPLLFWNITPLYPFEAGNTVSWTMSQYVLLATFPRAATSRTSTTSRLMAWGIGVEAPSAPGLMTTERTYNMRLQLWLGGLG